MNTINVFHAFQLLHSQVQSVAEKLHSSPSLGQVRLLSLELDAVTEKAAAVFEKSDLFRGLEDEIVHLYGEIEDAKLKGKVSQIQKKANTLKQALENGEPIYAKQLKALKKEIYLFLQEYRPGLSDKRVIADAKQTVDCLERGVSKKDCLPLDPDAAELTPGEFEEILEVTNGVYQGRLNEAKVRFHQLPQEHKKRVQAHMGLLGATLFEDPFETMQALFATVNELVGTGETYPTQEEIEEHFTGLYELEEHERETFPRQQLG